MAQGPLVNAPDLPEWLTSLLARLGGSSSGGMVAVIFAQPKTRKEAAQRFVVSFIVGLIFGPNAIPYLGMLHVHDDTNGLVAASFLVGFAAWLLLGYAVKFLRMRADAQLQQK